MVRSCTRIVSWVLLLLPMIPPSVGAETVEFDPQFNPGPEDLITLPQDGSARLFFYDVGGYSATDASIVITYANRDSLFHMLGETVEGAGLSIYVSPFFHYEISDVVSPLFQEEAVGFLLFQPGGKVEVELRSTGPDALLIGSIKLALTDDQPPAATTDLAVGSVGPGSLRLNWTAPGDDGDGGRAHAYDLRYSTQPVGSDTTAWFDAATEAAGLPDPGPAGSVEGYYMTNLLEEMTYYIVLRTEDEFGNLSAFSNVAEGTTLVNAAGTALRFDGYNDLVKLPDELAVIYDDFTIEMWFQIYALGENDNVVLIDMRNMVWGDGDDRNAGLYVGVRVHRQPYISFLTTDDYYYNHVLLPEWSAQVGEWGHVAFTREGTTLIGYWNGEPVAWDYDINPGPILWRPDYPGTFIGLGWPNHEWGFEGAIDEVRIWNVARTTEEIQAAMSRPLEGTEPGFAAYWKMDDGTGQIVTDHTGGGSDGTLGETEYYENSDPVWIVSDAPIGQREALSVRRARSADPLPLRAGPVPNPFAGATSIGYRVEESTAVTIRIYDINGRLVRALLDRRVQPAGFYGAEWRGEDDNGRRVAGGQYYYEAEIGSDRRSGKITILR